ncbi:uncharacterized protein I303_100618 [Kwoniella dejecticola CBS 10117]|uniref:Uncharacterized protein n=1 Tax=Kwoniella dejecticola CBS 10117 TaxID=1296121 RepID=A0A1A6AFH6_9TREE|nr:uncharacterized protein I303_00621 [Kwoniella dejecticola CBS 10117]OBR88804.1 hypothetical protein I303_00621 [Kwoniella dejecticola CBS 10117]
MADDKKPWLGKETFPTIWIWICFLFNIVGILALLILIVAEFIIIVADFHNYVAQYGHNYPSREYQGGDGVGYVDWTNAPKHMGSAIWMILYQLSIVILATLAIASDAAWRASSYNAWGGKWIEAFYAGGLMSGPNHPNMLYYVAANACFKCFIVVLYMSQSFYGMEGNTSHKSPYANSDTDGTQYYNNGNNGNSDGNWHGDWQGGDHSSWRRNNDYDSSRPPWRIYGTEAFVYYMGWVVLFSILPSMIAFLYLTQYGKEKAAAATAGDAEKKGEEEKK